MKELEQLKQKYKKEWEEAQGDEKLFMKVVKAKEALRKAKEKIKAKAEEERKRRTRALILLASMIIEKEPERIEFFVKYNKIKAKEGKEEVDYTKYILEEVQKAKEKKATPGTSGTPGSSGR